MNELPPPAPAAEPIRRRSPASFFVRRWRAQVPLRRVLGRDMLLVGTAINLGAALAGLLLFASDAPTSVAASVYFAPVPYNLFLFVAVWRAAEQVGEPHASLVRIVAFAWLVAAILI